MTRVLLVNASLLACAIAAPGGRTSVGFREAELRASADTSPAVARAIADAERSAADVGVARGIDDPTLSLGTTRYSGRQIAGLSVALPGASKPDEIRAARLDLAGAQRLVERARLDARAAAGRSWVALRLAERTTALTDASTANARRLRDAAQERFTRGEIPRRDLVQAEAELARAEAGQIAAETERASADARLRALLGADGALSTSGDGPDPLAGDPPAEEAVLSALAASPDAAADAAAVAGADARVAAAKLGYVPSLTASAGITAGDPSLPGTDAAAGVDLNLPLGGRHGAEVRSARAARARAQAEASSAARLRAADARAALGDVVASRARFRALAERALPAQAESTKMTEEAWNAGEAGFLEVVLARRAATDVEREKEEAWASAMNAAIELARITGRTVGAIEP